MPFLFWQLRFRHRDSVADRLANALSQTSQDGVLTQSLVTQSQSQLPQETAPDEQGLVSERLANIAAAVETAPGRQGSVAERLANALHPEVRCQKNALVPMCIITRFVLCTCACAIACVALSRSASNSMECYSSLLVV